MNTTILALRALTATLFQRIMKPIIWVVVAVIGLLWALVIYLGISVDAWWYLALAFILPVTLIVASVVAALWLLSKRLLPRRLTKSEQSQLLEVSDKVIRIAEVRATPPPLMAFLIAKDVVRRRRSTYIEDIVNDTRSLRDDIASIRAMFTPKAIR